MKTLPTFLFLCLLLASCDDDCQSCKAVAYSDEKRSCGFANDGPEIVAEEELGMVCDSEERAELRKSFEMAIPSFSQCGERYVIRTVLECQ